MPEGAIVKKAAGDVLPLESSVRKAVPDKPWPVVELYGKTTLYHGSVDPNLREFLPNGPESTQRRWTGAGLGFKWGGLTDGVYLTSSIPLALFYTDSNRPRHPIVYEVEIDGLKILDARSQERVTEILRDGYLPYLKEKAAKSPGDARLKGELDELEGELKRGEHIGAGRLHFLPAEFYKSFGYDGVCIGKIPTEVANNDKTVFEPYEWIIFNAAKAKIVGRVPGEVISVFRSF